MSSHIGGYDECKHMKMISEGAATVGALQLKVAESRSIPVRVSEVTSSRAVCVGMHMHCLWAYIPDLAACWQISQQP